MTSLRRVLIVQPYGIGDLLFVTPVLRALRLIPTVETVDLVLGSRTEEVVNSNPHADEIFAVDKDLFHRRKPLENFSEIASLTRRLRKKKYDLLLDYSLRGEYAFWARFFLGIPRTAGFDYKGRGFLHTHRLPIPNGFTARHAVDFFCGLAEKAGVPAEDRFLEFYLTDEDREMTKQQTRPYIVVSPGGGESWGRDAHFKRWPVRFFAELLNRLEGRTGSEGVFILGSSGEKNLGDELKNLLRLPAVNLAGELTLTESAALIENAALFAGNDGGLVHLARSFRVPLIAFYGPVDPEVYGPYPPSKEAAAVFKEGLECRPCYQKFRYNAACEHRDCLQALTPAEVLDRLDSRAFFDSLSDNAAKGSF